MSGVVSYDLYTARFGSSGIGFTSEGGVYETFVNNTGTSVKGTVVVASTTVYNGVDIAPAKSPFPIGVIYESGIANGSSVKVVVYGKAQVLLQDTVASYNGYWCGVSKTVAGRMEQSSSDPAVAEHVREIGHSLQGIAGGTDVLSLVQIHFN